MTLAEIERAWSKPALDLTPATQGGFLIELATVRGRAYQYHSFQIQSDNACAG